MKKFGLTLLTAFAGAAVALGGYKFAENKYIHSMSFEDQQKVYYATSNHLTPAPSNLSSAGQVDFTEAAAAVTPGVVYIRTTYTNHQSNDQQSELQQMFGNMFGQRMPQMAPEMASGSGVIISPDGYIVTNNHVVDKAEKIEVVTNDHQDFKAKVIGTDPNTDLALIKIEGHNLPIVKLGNSDNVKVGEWVLAVGNPFKLTSTVTAGIVSAKGRSIGIIGQEDNQQQESPFGRTQYQQTPKLNQAIESFIQTDAAINPGNSGGALVNTNGELIGINSAIASHTGSYEGYGFAIPINLAKKVLDDIQKFGAVKRGYVGISFRELDEDAAADLHTDKTAGLYVNTVVPGGGAEQAGIKEGDIITKIDGSKVYESSDLQERVGRLEPGDKIRLTVLRGNDEKNFTVTLKANNPAPEKVAVTKSAEELFNRIGASFVPVNAEMKAKFHVNAGVVVTQVRDGGLFDYTEVPVGSVITEINKRPIASIDDMDRALGHLEHGVLTISGYYPDGSKLRSTIQIQ
ncbi:Do family serine endopeptidase [Mucilaginibacter sp.]|uniref:Do family serine endopeptidase n=1 Tax=Mucilaginibacter sp. TaxID=1882438 RepID=UPI00284B1528|nr:Do family serine endopeptidase [Mucilaginibacter sp.]MDR3696415.1 Do family serine endopeptidase [Mucilaginibacter sp.]